MKNQTIKTELKNMKNDAVNQMENSDFEDSFPNLSECDEIEKIVALHFEHKIEYFGLPINNTEIETAKECAGYCFKRTLGLRFNLSNLDTFFLRPAAIEYLKHRRIIDLWDPENIKSWVETLSTVATCSFLPNYLDTSSRSEEPWSAARNFIAEKLYSYIDKALKTFEVKKIHHLCKFFPDIAACLNTVQSDENSFFPEKIFNSYTSYRSFLTVHTEAFIRRTSDHIRCFPECWLLKYDPRLLEITTEYFVRKITNLMSSEKITNINNFFSALKKISYKVISDRFTDSYTLSDLQEIKQFDSISFFHQKLLFDITELYLRNYPLCPLTPAGESTERIWSKAPLSESNINQWNAAIMLIALNILRKREYLLDEFADMEDWEYVINRVSDLNVSYQKQTEYWENTWIYLDIRKSEYDAYDTLLNNIFQYFRRDGLIVNFDSLADDISTENAFKQDILEFLLDYTLIFERLSNTLLKKKSDKPTGKIKLVPTDKNGKIINRKKSSVTKTAVEAV